MNTRISKDEWAMRLAETTALRSTCLRRQVGCVLLDSQWRVLSTGYNGVASGEPHCNLGKRYYDQRDDITGEWSWTYEHACPGAASSTGTNLDGCHAIHAEQNALLQCKDPDKIHYCFTTTSPCLTCVKLLMNTGCRSIVFAEAYPHYEAEALWRQNIVKNRQWQQLVRP